LSEGIFLLGWLIAAQMLLQASIAANISFERSRVINRLTGEKYHNSARKEVINRMAGLACAMITAPLAGTACVGLMAENGTTDVLFKQERLGSDGQLVTIRKFRTIYRDVELTIPFSGPDDPRTKGLARALRRSGLDKWPQLPDVIAGKEHFFGLRSINEEHAQSYRKLLGIRKDLVDRRLEAGQWCSGHVSPTNVTDHLYPEHTREVIINRFEDDLHYAHHGTLHTDLKTFLRMPGILALAGLGYRRQPPEAEPVLSAPSALAIPS